MTIFVTLFGIQMFCWALVIASGLKRLVPPGEYSDDSLGILFVAMAVLPHWLGVISLVTLAALPATAGWQYAASLVIAVIMMSVLRKDIRELMAHIVSQFEWRDAVIPIISLSIVMIVAVPIFWENFSSPLFAHDSLIYAYEARLLTEGAGIASLPFFGNRLDAATVVNHAHGPFFSAYLAQAYFAGYATLKFAFQFTIPSMLFGLAAFGRSTGLKWAATIAVLGFFMTRPAEYISHSSSRDAFRISTLAVLAAMLLWQLRYSAVVSVAGRVNVALSVLFSATAHALNLIFLPFIGLVAAIAGWLQQRSYRNVIEWLWLPGIALLLVGAPYIFNLFYYDNPLGLGVYFPYYKDTPLWEAFVNHGHWTGDPSFRELVLAIAKDYGAWQFGIILFSSLVCLALFFFNRKKWSLIFVGGFSLVMITLPLLLTLKIGEVDLSGAFVSNFRYPLSTFAFIGLFIYVPVHYFVTHEKLTGSRVWLRKALLSAVLLGGAVFSWSVVEEWRTASYGERVLEEGEWQIVELSSQIEVDSTWYSNRFSPAFYATAEIRPRLLQSEDGYDLYASTDIDVVLERLVEKKVGMVSLMKSPTYPWHATTLYRILSGCEGIEYFPLHRWDVFLIGTDFSVSTCRQRLAAMPIGATGDSGQVE